MESSKQEAVDYDGKEALATLLVECSKGRLTEEQARGQIDEALSGKDPRMRRDFEKSLKSIEAIMAVVPPASRREVMTKLMKSAAQQALKRHAARLAKRMRRRAYPALRHSAMLRIASILFDEEKIESIFIPLVSDYLMEYRRARAESWLKAQVVGARHWYGFGCACGLDKIFPWLERLSRLIVWLFGRD